MRIIAEVRSGWVDYATDPFWGEPNTVPNFPIDVRGKTPSDAATELRDRVTNFFNAVVASGIWPADKPKLWTRQLVGFDHSTPTTDQHGLWMLQADGDRVPVKINPPGTTEYVGLFHDAMLLRQGVTPGEA